MRLGCWRADQKCQQAAHNSHLCSLALTQGQIGQEGPGGLFLSTSLWWLLLNNSPHFTAETWSQALGLTTGWRDGPHPRAGSREQG